jgi:type II secretory pathway component GspD/PulD (secretin)
MNSRPTHWLTSAARLAALGACWAWLAFAAPVAGRAQQSDAPATDGATPDPTPQVTPEPAATPVVPDALRWRYDKDKHMVAVEALVVEVTEEVTRQLGLTYSFNQTQPNGVVNGGFLTGGLAALGPALQAVDLPILIQGTEGNNSIEFQDRLPGLGVSLVGMHVGAGVVAARLRALLDRGDATIRTRPVAVGLNNTRIKISAINQVPYQDINDKDRLYVAYEDVGVELEVVPSIVDVRPGLGVVTLDLRTLEVSSVSGFVTAQKVDRPVFSVSSTNTKVTLNNGETFVIGGLKTRRTVHIEDRVPLLGRIWLLGYLFRSQEDIERHMDVLFFVTPYILAPGENVFFPFDFKHQRVLGPSGGIDRAAE